MTALIQPRSAKELADALREMRTPTRLVGSGSRQQRLPDVPEATRIELLGLDRIDRLDAGDQTCSVQAGVRREVLDAAAHEHGLCLPCAGDGTIGGLFASDPIGAITAGGPEPRSLVLGIEAVTADGTEFRSGARVSKSVAGFDLHRLFVGSRGRLFAATLLHLRLKPRPRASVSFRRGGLDSGAALELFQRLRGLAVPPAALHLSQHDGECSVNGRIDGRATYVARTMRELELEESAPWHELLLDVPPSGEIVAGNLPPSRCTALLTAAPVDARFVMHGGGRFELALSAVADTDTLLPRLPELGIHACIVRGASARRGRGTPLDPGQERLAASLAATFDPHGILA